MSDKVTVRYGKPLDVGGLKANVINNFAGEAGKYRKLCTKIYSSAKLKRVAGCPVCAAPSGRSAHRLTIYGASYHQCLSCDHYYVIRRPDQALIESFYTSGRTCSSIYTDRRLLNLRVREVALPKAKWVVEQFRKIRGRDPVTILDIGAGGGHFVHACRQLGLQADGVELSRYSREFCRKKFGFELIGDDFTRAWKKWSGIDIVTFWGVLEHVPSPPAMLRAARKVLNERHGIMAAAVPRWDCVSTRVQTVFPNTVIRHLDPSGHIHIFSDRSLQTAFKQCGFAPVSAWYYGMDAYELIVQITHAFGLTELTKKHKQLINQLQSEFDHARLSDEIALLGRPVR